MELFSYLFRYLISALLLIIMYSMAILVGIISRSLAWRIIKQWDRIFLKMFGVKVIFEYDTQYIDPVSGLAVPPSSGGVVIGLTQKSLIDPIIAQSKAPRIFMSIWNIEYALIPFIGWISWIFGWVIIRQLPNQAKGEINKAESYLRKGGLVYLSIEGKRSIDGSLSPYKKGPVVLAIQAKAKVFPIIIHNSDKCMPHGAWKIKPGKVTIRLLNEISTEGMNYEDRDLLIGKLRKIAGEELLRWESINEIGSKGNYLSEHRVWVK